MSSDTWMAAQFEAPLDAAAVARLREFADERLEHCGFFTKLRLFENPKQGLGLAHVHFEGIDWELFEDFESLTEELGRAMGCQVNCEVIYEGGEEDEDFDAWMVPHPGGDWVSVSLTGQKPRAPAAGRGRKSRPVRQQTFLGALDPASFVSETSGMVFASYSSMYPPELESEQQEAWATECAHAVGQAPDSLERLDLGGLVFLKGSDGALTALCLPIVRLREDARPLLVALQGRVKEVIALRPDGPLVAAAPRLLGVEVHVEAVAGPWTPRPPGRKKRK